MKFDKNKIKRIVEISDANGLFKKENESTERYINSMMSPPFIDIPSEKNLCLLEGLFVHSAFEQAMRDTEQIITTVFNTPDKRVIPQIIRVIFNEPATIVFWNDGTKTVVKAQNEVFDKEKGLAMAIAKKAMGNCGNYFEEFKKWTEVI